MKKTLILILISVVLITSVFAANSIPLEVEAKVGYGSNNEAIKKTPKTNSELWGKIEYKSSGLIAGVNASYKINKDLAIEADFDYLLPLKQSSKLSDKTSSGSTDFTKDQANFSSMKIGVGARYSMKLADNIGVGFSAGLVYIRSNAIFYDPNKNITVGSMKFNNFGLYVGAFGEYAVMEKLSVLLGADISYTFIATAYDYNFFTKTWEKAEADDSVKTLVTDFRLGIKAGVCYKF